MAYTKRKPASPAPPASAPKKVAADEYSVTPAGTASQAAVRIAKNRPVDAWPSPEERKKRDFMGKQHKGPPKY